MPIKRGLRRQKWQISTWENWLGKTGEMGDDAVRGDTGREAGATWTLLSAACTGAEVGLAQELELLAAEDLAGEGDVVDGVGHGKSFFRKLL